VPVTCDAEAGYSDDLGKVGETITALINAGAVGINLEDGKAPHELHLKKIEAARNAAERAGVNLFINARTDVYLKQLVPAEQALTETLRRAQAIKQAGASGLFVPGVFKADEIGAIVEGAGLPLNVMARPGVPKLAELKALGVKRISAATSIFATAMTAAREAAAAFLADADSDALWARRGEQLDYNKLFG
jgi:2-methylisocitrate lyase-like PEP mutase family enzyme